MKYLRHKTLALLLALVMVLNGLTGAALMAEDEFDFENEYFKLLEHSGKFQIDWYECGLWSDYSSNPENPSYTRLNWKLTPVDGEWFVLTNRSDGQAITPMGNGITPGTRVALAPYQEGNVAQMWKFGKVDDTYCQIIHRETGLVLGLEDGAEPANGVHIALYEWSAKPETSCQWSVVCLTDNKTVLQGAEVTEAPQPQKDDTKPEVKSARLIEENYIEIMWTMPVANSELTDNYVVTVNGNAVTEDEWGVTNYYDGKGDYMTSLQLNLKNGLADPENAKITVKIVNDGEDDIATKWGVNPEEASTSFGYKAFYTQSVTSEEGIVIKSDSTVDKAYLEQTAKTVDFMLSAREDIAKLMREAGAAIGIAGMNENVWYLPEFRASVASGTAPADGLGGLVSGFYLGRMLQDNVLIHEFGHAIKGIAISQIHDSIRAYEDAYIHAKLTGIWEPFAYANSNAEEFFACLTGIWFNTDEGNGNETNVNTKEELKIYDPQTYEFFASIYPMELLPEDCWDYSRFVDETVVDTPPETPEIQDPVDPDEANLPAEDYDLDKHYFKIYSYLGTNGVQYGWDDDSQYENGWNITTWWDYSNSDYDYNFDAMSWKVTETEDGYYRFTAKFPDEPEKLMCLMPQDGSGEAGTPVVAAPLDEENDAQLWKLVRTKGYFCQIVNKMSGLVMGTENNAMPADGTRIVLTAYEEDPSYSSQWRVIRLKDKPGDENLTDGKYCIRPVKTSGGENTSSGLPFADVKADAAYFDAVAYVYENGLMNGTNGGFEPESSLNRAMVAQILYNLAGKPDVPQGVFSDVGDERWFAGPVNWAASKEIVGGYADGTFLPLSEVTREQLAAMLYRYAQYMEYSVENSGEAAAACTDIADVHAYAAEAVAWAVESGVLEARSSGALEPRESATRAEVAIALMSFCENVAK